MVRGFITPNSTGKDYTMSEKKRYLVGYRHSATVPKDIESVMDSFATEQKEVRSVRKLKTGHCILEMTEEQALELAKKQPDLIIEEDQELEMFFPMPGIMPRVPLGVETSLNVKVVDEKNDQPVSDVTIYCAGSEVTYEGVTDKNGVAHVKVYETQLKHVIVSPKDKYWSKVIPSPKMEKNAQISVRLKEIPVNGSYNWGHLHIGIDKVSQKFTGRGVKVAVIDSGIANHEDLKTTGGYNTLDGQDTKAWNVDEKGHGTHCTGIISAQQNQVGITGVAPGAEIFSLKVFPGGKFSDLIEAINWCIDNYMDVISMSLGSSSPSVQIEQALMEANERGITCIAAAGNEGGQVSYPAAYESVIAVSAIGKFGTFPEDSAHTLKMGDIFGYDGEVFLAKFSNFGPQIAVCAPGVAILSSVPTGYVSWDGTSMACPFISGLAALILEAYPEIRTGDGSQSYSVREIIRSSATDIGLPPEMQGAGLPNAEVALASAYAQREYEEQTLASYREYMESILERTKRCTRNIEQSLTKLDKV